MNKEQESVLKNLEESGHLILILDKGLLYFVKFIIGILGLFVVLGVFLYGIDLKKTHDELNKAKLELHQAKLSLEADLNRFKAQLKDTEERVARAEDASVEAVNIMTEQLEEIQIKIETLNKQQN